MYLNGINWNRQFDPDMPEIIKKGNIADCWPMFIFIPIIEIKKSYESNWILFSNSRHFDWFIDIDVAILSQTV